MPKRKSSFELLRIVAMVMIIAYHLTIHSSFSDQLLVPQEKLGGTEPDLF